VEKSGWHLLGSGIEATVAEHPNRRYVLKIWPKTSRYTAFVEFVRDNAANPHVPRFSRYTRPVPGTNYVYARMEKLSPITENKLKKTYPAELLWLFAVGAKNNISGLTGNPWYFASDQMLRFGIRVTSTTDLNKDLEEIWEKFGYPPPAWVEICDKLVDSAKQHGFAGFDLHNENFMLRDQTLVITDPWF